MSRKTTPPAHKPVFDAESILRFAAMGSEQSANHAEAGTAKPDRHSVTLQLKADVIKSLKAEAESKGKTIDQIVAKLVNKHLHRH